MAEHEHHPFDPTVRKRIHAAITEAKSVFATFASPRTTDLEQLLERDTYAEKTRLQLADKCATYRSQLDELHAKRDELHTQLDDLHARINAVRGLQVTKGPDGGWLVRVDLVLQALAGGVAAPEMAKPTPNGREEATTAPETADRLVHMWARDENDNPTGYALCDTGDGAYTTIDGQIANSTWQVNCPKCEEIRDRGAEQRMEQEAQTAEYEKWREAEDSAGRGVDREEG